MALSYRCSKLFKKHWGVKAIGKWAFITTKEKRIATMKTYAQRIAGSEASMFYFTTFADYNERTALTVPIWHQVGSDQRKPLFAF